ncbi:MAG: XRE family transcriptional regulator [Rhizobiaceae bacterium]|nr:XRE family transcriptional regulator [Rhizobiaceae bacterium]MCV0405813.1 XRE family transcriptional regulator [Rhizobiaceae bacterium]
MSTDLIEPDSTDRALAERLRALRVARGWSLETLAAMSGVSRATLSRLETGETSPTASQLGRLCAAHGMTLSRLMAMVEDGFAACLPRAEQPVWTDRTTGFTRRLVSPPSRALAGEAIEGELAPGASIDYKRPPRPGLEHHLVMLEGKLELTVDGRHHALGPGDCLRYQLHGESRFATPPTSGARYLIFMV